MRVAALYDVHGNLPALEAALVDVEAAGVDLIVVGGDLASGPLPRETLERLLALGERARFLRGNADRELVEVARGHHEPHPGGLGEAWVAQQVSREQLDFLADLPEHVVVELDGLGQTLFCHGSPRSDEETLTAETPAERVREALEGVEQRLVVCGHTHMQFDRVVAATRVVNAGSVGMPYGAPGAHWALLGPEVELRRTPFDLEQAADRIRRSDWPIADEFAAENVLTQPSVAEAMTFLERWEAERAGRRQPGR